ncbi:MAG: FAD-binding oxidoreductase [Candidatus Bathyarchaeia archaeon]
MELESIVGADHVFDDDETLIRYSKDSSTTRPRKPSFVVRPRDTNEVVKIVRLANRRGIPIVPSSSDVHFHGTTIPRQGGVVVDLRRMGRILEVDGRNRVARIEPGVTWGSLQSRLKDAGLMALNPLLPHWGKSVLTSHLEREPILITKYEYGDPVLAMEVVLPTGGVLRTGSASAPGAPEDTIVDLVGPYGPGLDFFRLFQGAQGTLGIVTWMAIKVERLPEFQELYFIPFESVHNAIEPMYAIQRLRLGSECFLLNSSNLAKIVASKPTEIEKLTQTLPEWSLVICLASTPRRPKERMMYEEESLMELGSRFHLDIQSRLPGARGAEGVVEQLLRQPWPRSEVYWRHRLKGGCQDLSFHTTMERVPAFVRQAHEIASKFEYSPGEVGCYVQPMEWGRASYCELDFPYEPDDPNDVGKVVDLSRQLGKALFLQGALFTRPYGTLSEFVYDMAGSYTVVLKKIKTLLDPNNVMNPGRLCF